MELAKGGILRRIMSVRHRDLGHALGEALQRREKEDDYGPLHQLGRSGAGRILSFRGRF